jgi:deoxyribonuclease V
MNKTSHNIFINYSGFQRGISNFKLTSVKVDSFHVNDIKDAYSFCINNKLPIYDKYDIFKYFIKTPIKLKRTSDYKKYNKEDLKKYALISYIDDLLKLKNTNSLQLKGHFPKIKNESYLLFSDLNVKIYFLNNVKFSKKLIYKNVIDRIRSSTKLEYNQIEYAFGIEKENIDDIILKIIIENDILCSNSIREIYFNYQETVEYINKIKLEIHGNKLTNNNFEELDTDDKLDNLKINCLTVNKKKFNNKLSKKYKFLDYSFDSDIEIKFKLLSVKKRKVELLDKIYANESDDVYTMYINKKKNKLPKINKNFIDNDEDSEIFGFRFNIRNPGNEDNINTVNNNNYEKNNNYTSISKFQQLFHNISETQKKQIEKFENELKKKLNFTKIINIDDIEYIGGVDTQYLENNSLKGIAGIVVIKAKTFEIVYHDYIFEDFQYEYCPSYLDAREGPKYYKLIDNLKINCPKYIPQVIIVDGNGRMNRNDFGLACWVGALSQIATVGYIKKYYRMKYLTQKRYENIINKLKVNESEAIFDNNNILIGYILRFTEKDDPLIINPGNMIDAVTSLNICKKLNVGQSLPLPTFLADLFVREMVNYYQNWTNKSTNPWIIGKGKNLLEKFIKKNYNSIINGTFNISSQTNNEKYDIQSNNEIEDGEIYSYDSDLVNENFKKNFENNYNSDNDEIKSAGYYEIEEKHHQRNKPFLEDIKENLNENNSSGIKKNFNKENQIANNGKIPDNLMDVDKNSPEKDISIIKKFNPFDISKYKDKQIDNTDKKINLNDNFVYQTPDKKKEIIKNINSTKENNSKIEKNTAEKDIENKKLSKKDKIKSSQPYLKSSYITLTETENIINEKKSKSVTKIKKIKNKKKIIKNENKKNTNDLNNNSSYNTTKQNKNIEIISKENKIENSIGANTKCEYIYEYYDKFKSNILLTINLNYFGIRNIGNTCYFNSLIQMLKSCDLFYEIIVNSNCSNNTHSLLRNIFKNIDSNKLEKEDIIKFLENFEFIVGRYYDVMDLFEKLLDKIIDECKNTDHFDKIKETFEIGIHRKIFCNGHEHERFENEYSIRLSISTLLFDATKSYMEYDLNDYLCSNTNSRYNAKGKNKFIKLPQYLIIALNRLILEENKNNDVVFTPDNIDLDEFNDENIQNKYMFSLSGIIIHKYTIINQIDEINNSLIGHFTFLKKENFINSKDNENDGILFDDLNVYSCNFSKIKNYVIGNNQNDIEYPSSYIFLYKKINKNFDNKSLIKINNEIHSHIQLSYENTNSISFIKIENNIKFENSNSTQIKNEKFTENTKRKIKKLKKIKPENNSEKKVSHIKDNYYLDILVNRLTLQKPLKLRDNRPQKNNGKINKKNKSKSKITSINDNEKKNLIETDIDKEIEKLDISINFDKSNSDIMQQKLNNYNLAKKYINDRINKKNYITTKRLWNYNLKDIDEKYHKEWEYFSNNFDKMYNKSYKIDFSIKKNEDYEKQVGEEGFTGNSDLVNIKKHAYIPFLDKVAFEDYINSNAEDCLQNNIKFTIKDTDFRRIPYICPICKQITLNEKLVNHFFNFHYFSLHLIYWTDISQHIEQYVNEQIQNKFNICIFYVRYFTSLYYFLYKYKQNNDIVNKTLQYKLDIMKKYINTELIDNLSQNKLTESEALNTIKICENLYFDYFIHNLPQARKNRIFRQEGINKGKRGEEKNIKKEIKKENNTDKKIKTEESEADNVDSEKFDSESDVQYTNNGRIQQNLKKLIKKIDNEKMKKENNNNKNNIKDNKGKDNAKNKDKILRKSRKK